MWNDVGNNYSHLRNPDLTKEYGSPANFKKILNDHTQYVSTNDLTFICIFHF